MKDEKTGSDGVYFGGYSKPNYTMVPDELFDQQLPHLSGSQLKVLLYIIRRTFGFKKDSDAISLNQICNGITTRDGRVLDKGTGLARRHVIAAAKALGEMGLITSEKRSSLERGFESTIYSLNLAPVVSDALVPKGNKGASSQREHALVPQREQGLVPKGNLQDTELQETVEQETDSNISNIRKVKPVRSVGKGSVQASTSAVDASEEATTRGLESVGDVLTRHRGRTPRNRPRPETETDEYQRIQALIADRAREFIDIAPLKSSTTRAWNLFQKSGVAIAVFESKIFQAKALTLESTARITKTVEDPTYRVRRKSKMAYFFATLEDQLNLVTPEERARRGGSRGTPQGAKRGRPAKPKAPEEEPTIGRKPDSEGPYAAYIKN